MSKIPETLDPVRERLAKRSAEEGDCLVWQGNTNSAGYGKIKIQGSTQYVHRVSFRMSYGDIPEGMVVDHICHNRGCWKPEHLQAVTQHQNQQNRSGAMRNSQSGVRGVFPARGGRWRAVVTVNGKPIRLGTFHTIAEAESAAIEGRRHYFTNSLMDLAS